MTKNEWQHVDMMLDQSNLDKLNYFISIYLINLVHVFCFLMDLELDNKDKTENYTRCQNLKSFLSIDVDVTHRIKTYIYGQKTNSHTHIYHQNCTK